MTKCTFHKFGPSGTVQKFDGLCVLPLNIINEKIYVFLWFWFIVVAIITAIQILTRLVIITIPSLREVLLGRRLVFLRRKGANNRNKVGHTSPHIHGYLPLTWSIFQLTSICQTASVSDWFILYQLAKNIDPLIFNEFVGDLHEKMLEMKRLV